METTLHVDTANLADLLAAQSLIETLIAQASADTARPNPAGLGQVGKDLDLEGESRTLPARDELVPVLRSVVGGDGDYGHNRHGFLRAVAEAGDWGADIRDQLAHHFRGDGRAMGGTRSSIQRNWEASGGQMFATFLIDYSNDANRYVMYAPARPVVLKLLAEIGHAGQGERGLDDEQ